MIVEKNKGFFMNRRNLVEKTAVVASATAAVNLFAIDKKLTNDRELRKDIQSPQGELSENGSGFRDVFETLVTSDIFRSK